MSITIDRGLLTHTVVVLGVCVGAWMMLVQPQMKGLRTAEAALAAHEKAQQDVNDHIFEKTVQKMKDVKSRIAEIERCNGLMHDSSRLYGLIMDLAAKHGVTIQNLQPGSEKISADAKTSVNRIDLSAEGAFDKVALFLDAIIELDGFVRPVSLNVVPMRDETNPTVMAHFSCEAMSFKLPEALAGLGGIMPSPDSVRRMTAIGLFLLPVALVKLTGLYLGQQGPSTAQAAEADPSAPTANAAPTKAPTWTSRQIEAGKYVASLRNKSCGPTPFLYEARDPGSAAVTVSSDPVPSGTTTTDVSKYTVQAILSSSIGTTALINGKPYRVGDTIRDSSWVIQTISAESRSVTLREGAQGRLETIHVEIPSIGKQ